MMARPTAASAAATAMEKMTKRIPERSEGFAENRQKARKLRLAAPSMSSMPMRIMMAFDRERAAASPNAKRTAEMERRTERVTESKYEG